VVILRGHQHESRRSLLGHSDQRTTDADTVAQNREVRATSELASYPPQHHFQLEERNMVSNYAAAAVALLVCLAGPSLASAAEATGGKIIKDAIRGNLAEVKVGQLAQEKDASRGRQRFRRHPRDGSSECESERDPVGAANEYNAAR
jgi:hypothetical protein